jgi:hypothetical protein
MIYPCIQNKSVDILWGVKYQNYMHILATLPSNVHEVDGILTYYGGTVYCVCVINSTLYT